MKPKPKYPVLTYITVSEHFMHVDALCVENCLFLSHLCCSFTQQAAGQALGFHDDGILGQRGEH